MSVYLKGIHTSINNTTSFLWDTGKHCRTRKDATKVASDLVLHCLHTEFTFRIFFN